jgi:hypothetical protein
MDWSRSQCPLRHDARSRLKPNCSVSREVVLRQFADSVLDTSDRITACVHALDNLQRRFPPSVIQTMSAEDRSLFDRIAQDHRSAARQAAHTLTHTLEPAFEILHVEPSSTGRGSLVESAVRLDRLVNGAFAGAQSDLSDPELYAQLRAALERVLELLG